MTGILDDSISSIGEDSLVHEVHTCVFWTAVPLLRRRRFSSLLSVLSLNCHSDCCAHPFVTESQSILAGS
jgi:hypothetical protein